MIDAKGPINPPSEGNQFIFLIVDAFSHFVTLICEPKKNAHYAFTALFEHLKFGLPEEIRSDKGSKYVITELTHHCKCFEIKIKQSTTCAPWTNGLLEGRIRIIVKFIRTLVDGNLKTSHEKKNFLPTLTIHNIRRD